MWLFKLFPLLICALSILGMLVIPLSSSAIPQAILQDGTINYLHRDNRLTQTANLYLVFEDSLLNDSNVLYQLQQVFFPFANHLNVARVPFNISIIVDKITNQGMNHPNTPFNCTRAVNGCIWPGVLIDWHPEVTADLYSDDLRQYVLSIHQKLKELEFISWSLLQLLAEFGQREDHPLVSFTLTVSSLPALPNKEDATQALLSLMIWVKAYARAAFSQPVMRSDQDKGDVILSNSGHDFYLELYILILFISLNVFLTLMAGVFLKSFSAFVVKKATAILKESTKMLSVYWATGLVLTAANIACLGADLYAFQITLVNAEDHNILYAKLFLIAFVLMSEPFIVYYTTRNFSIILNVPDRVVKALCCCFSNVYGSRFAHTIAVLNILWFTHRLLTAFITILFHIVVSPAETFTAMTLVFSVIVILIFLTAYLLFTCRTPCKRLSVRVVCRIFCAVLTGTMAVAIVVSFSLVYLMLLDNGLRTSGVGGFILSLFPPFLFFMIGLIVQRKFIHSGKEANKIREQHDQEMGVSKNSGNITKLAEYQQVEFNSFVGKGVGKGRRLSLQHDLDDDIEVSRKSRRTRLDETSQLVRNGGHS